MSFEVTNICRYPVKGLSADPLDTVAVEAGQTLPYDRRYALAHASSRVDKAAPDWMPKTEFLMLARDEKLAQLGIAFDDGTQMLTILRKGRPVSRGALSSQAGRNVLETFLAAFLPDMPRGKPAIVEAPASKSFSDVPTNRVSIINLASVRDIERVLRQPIDPLRFRGNIYIDGGDAWAETGWIGKTLMIGDVTLTVEDPIGRCSATNVNPQTGERDMNIPLTLGKGFGHTNCGVYATIAKGGTLSRGDSVTVS